MKMLKMLIPFSSRTLAPAHSWPWYYCAWLASQHAWSEPHMGSMGYFQEKDEKQSIQQSRRAEGSIVPQQCHRLIASMPLLTDAGICAKGAPTKYWEHKLTYFKELEFFCFANPFFYYYWSNFDILIWFWYSNILRYWIFDFHEL